MEPLKFEPTVLKWAREKRFGPRIETLREEWLESWGDITPDHIHRFEAGTATASFAEIKILARIYRRPLAVFFLDSPPPEKGAPPDFRTLGSRTNRALSPEALLVIRKARRIQELSGGLAEELGDPFSFKFGRHSLDEDPSALAERARSDLGISLEEQMGCRTYEEFFEYLREKFETAGLITLKSGMQDSFPIEDCRAFSFTDAQPYLILVNNKDTEGAKNFSIVHEFGHVLLREAGLCNNFRAFANHRNKTNRVEVFCNQFAASFLVPGDALAARIKSRRKVDVETGDLDALANNFATNFKVSRFVILRRFLTLGYITAGTYKVKAGAWEKEDIPQRKKGGSFSLKTVFRKNGRAFSSLVMEAYKQGKIPYAGVSDFLGLKMKHLPRFEQLITPYAG